MSFVHVSNDEHPWRFSHLLRAESQTRRSEVMVTPLGTVPGYGPLPNHTTVTFEAVVPAGKLAVPPWGFVCTRKIESLMSRRLDCSYHLNSWP